MNSSGTTESPDQSRLPGRLGGIKRSLPLVTALLLAALLCLKSYLSPSFNWDMLAYVGNALDHGQNALELHREVYSRAAASLPAPAYANLVHGPEKEYREILAVDPDAFAKTRPLFHQRVLYIWGIRMLAWAGIDPFQASAAIGAIAAFATCAIMLWWLRPYASGWIMPIGVLPVAYALQWPEVARLSTPDTLTCALCLLAMYLIFERQSCARAALVLLVAAVFVRTETVILGGMTLGWLALPAAGRLRLQFMEVTLWLGAFAAAYLLLGHFYPSYTWRLLISYCMLNHAPVPVIVSFSATDYAALAWHMIRVILNQPSSMLLLCAWALALVEVWKNPRLRPLRDLLLLVGLNLAIRFGLFPTLDYRYHLLFVAITAVVGLQLVALSTGSRREGQPDLS